MFADYVSEFAKTPVQFGVNAEGLQEWGSKGFYSGRHVVILKDVEVYGCGTFRLDWGAVECRWVEVKGRKT